MEDFELAFAALLEFEGYKSEDPKDPGGQGLFGVSEKYYPEFVKANWDLPKEEAVVNAKQFYKTNIWIKCKCDDLPPPLNIFFFDACVNPGPGAAAGILNKSGRSAFRFLLYRMEWYRQDVLQHPNLVMYFRGWINRCLRLFVLYG